MVSNFKLYLLLHYHTLENMNISTKLFLEPNYGLANRLRAMASGLELAKELNRQLIIVWLNDHELNCPFEELFLPIPDTVFINKPYLWQFTKKSQQNNPITKLIVYLINKSLGFDYCAKELDISFFQKNSKNNIYKINKIYKNIFIQTSAYFLKDETILDTFKPAPEIQARIDQRTAQFGKNTVGLHIRRTDHSDAIANSPIELFKHHIDNEIAAQQDTVFYLSTDDPEVEVYLKNLYPEKMLVFSKEFSRNSIRGIKDAVVDLFCLANTRKLIGSYNSTFSEMAARIGQIDLHIIAQNS